MSNIATYAASFKHVMPTVVERDAVAEKLPENASLRLAEHRASYMGQVLFCHRPLSTRCKRLLRATLNDGTQGASCLRGL